MRKLTFSAVARLTVVGLLWLFFCGWFIGRMRAAGMEMTLLNLLPIPISGAIVFIPMYKKYIAGAGPSSPTNRSGDGKRKSDSTR